MKGHYLNICSYIFHWKKRSSIQCKSALASTTGNAKLEGTINSGMETPNFFFFPKIPIQISQKNYICVLAAQLKEQSQHKIAQHFSNHLEALYVTAGISSTRMEAGHAVPLHHTDHNFLPFHNVTFLSFAMISQQPPPNIRLFQ